MRPNRTHSVGEKDFKGLANAGITMMLRANESGSARRVTKTLSVIDRLVTEATDVVAASLLEGTRPSLKTFSQIQENLRACVKSLGRNLGEGWYVFPALGLGNDFADGSDAGKFGDPNVDGSDNLGVEWASTPDGNNIGTQGLSADFGKNEARRVQRYVDNLLEDKTACTDCGGDLDKKGECTECKGK